MAQSPPAALETALYPALKTFLQARGFSVKGEICGCDIVAVRDGEAPLLVITEMKLSFTLELVLQAVERLRVADAGAREAVESGYQTAVRLRAEVAYIKDREESIIAACDRVADGGKYRADIVSAVQRIRSGREEARAALAQQRDVYEEQARGHEAEIATLHAKLAAAAHEELRACSRIAVDLYAAGKQDDIAQALVSRQVHAQGRAS